MLLEQEAAEAQATVGALTDRMAQLKERLGTELHQERRLVMLVRGNLLRIVLPLPSLSLSPLPLASPSPTQVREELAIVRRDRDEKARDLRAAQVRPI